MPISTFLNKTCNINRKTLGVGVNEYGEDVITIPTVASNMPVRLERIYDQNLVEAYCGGDTVKALYMLYFLMGANVKVEDVVTINGVVPDFVNNASVNANELTIVYVEDAGGGKAHHLEVYAKYRKGIQ